MEVAGERKPRYMERTEAVIYGLGYYFQRQLATVQDRLAEVKAELNRKQTVRDSLPTNPITRQLASLFYGDWLTDYESERIVNLVGAEMRFGEIMSEVIDQGRVDRAEAELRKIITACLAHLTGTKKAGYIIRKSGRVGIEVATEAIEALAIICPEEAEKFRAELEKAKN